MPSPKTSDNSFHGHEEAERTFMRDLANVANLLRNVWRAKRQFLHHAVVEQAVIEPMLDQIHQEIAARGVVFSTSRLQRDDKE